MQINLPKIQRQSGDFDEEIGNHDDDSVLFVRRSGGFDGTFYLHFFRILN